MRQLRQLSGLVCEIKTGLIWHVSCAQILQNGDPHEHDETAIGGSRHGGADEPAAADTAFGAVVFAMGPIFFPERVQQTQVDSENRHPGPA